MGETNRVEEANRQRQRSKEATTTQKQDSIACKFPELKRILSVMAVLCSFVSLVSFCLSARKNYLRRDLSCWQLSTYVSPSSTCDNLSGMPANPHECLLYGLVPAQPVSMGFRSHRPGNRMNTGSTAARAGA